MTGTAVPHRADPTTLLGREAELAVFEGLPHAFWAYIEAPESDEAFALMAGFLSKRLA